MLLLTKTRPSALSLPAPHAADRRKLGASALSPNQRSCARRRLRVAIAAHRHARARAAARRKPGRNGKRAGVLSFVAQNRGEHYADLGNVRADAGAPRISTEAEAASAGRVVSSGVRAILKHCRFRKKKNLFWSKESSYGVETTSSVYFHNNIKWLGVQLFFRRICSQSVIGREISR